MRILIAYDSSDNARAAIDDLQRSGLPRTATAILVSVGETVLPTPLPASVAIDARATSHRAITTLVKARAEAAHAIDEAGELAEEGSQRVHARFPCWEVHREPVVGTPAQAIMQKADEWQADLILVGSHGTSALGRLLLGSVSKQVATESGRSVRVARNVVDRVNTPPRIILGVDGSPSAEAAVRAVASRAWPAGTETRVILVDQSLPPSGMVDLPPAATIWLQAHNHEQLATGRAMLEQTAEQLLAVGLLVSTRIEKGSPLHVLKDEARVWEADCIVVGARGFNSTLEGFRAGSLATALASSAPCPVEIVRAGQDEKSRSIDLSWGTGVV